VGRIADVDDDRRRTAASLQRALDTHREEVETRLSRQGRWTVALVVLAVLLVPAASWLVLRQMPEADPEARDDLAELRGEVARLSAPEGGFEALQERVAALTASVNGVAESLERLDKEQAAGVEAAFGRERDERRAADAGLEQRLGRLQAAQERLAGEMGMPHSTPRGTPARGAEAKPSEGMPPEAAAGEPGPARASQGQARAPAEPRGDAVTVAERDNALQLIGFFSLDELRRFSDRSDLPARVYYREESLRGRPWYVLIHSLHEDYEAAADERARLPPELAVLDIWIRALPRGSRLQVLQPAADRRGPAD
jgi:DamX protein